MIYLKIEGHDYQYGIDDILKLFFRDETILPVQEDDINFRDGIFIKNAIERREIDGKIVFELSTSIRDSKGEVSSFSLDVTEIVKESKESREAEKVLKWEIKRQLYKALVQYTKEEMPWGMLTGIRPAKIVHEMLDKNFGKEQIMEQLKNYYYLSSKKASLVYDVALSEKAILDNTGPNMVSLYIGIPFCPTRCLYCSFTSNPIKKYEKMVESYMAALTREIRSVGEMLRDRDLKIQSIYIGGGTPTSIDVQYLGKLLEEIEKNFCFDFVQEYTLEAGRPDSITVEKLETIAKSKVNRISINPQTMKDETLLRIGRSHTSDDIIEAFKLARKFKFDNINMDIIAGLPGEKLDDFLFTLEEVKKLSPENITVHTMSIKRASRLNEERNNYSLTEGTEVARMVDAAYDIITGMGLIPYYLYRQKNILGNLENIGYAMPGTESIYNVQIMEERQTIFALGAGAVTKVVYPEENRIERIFNVKNVEEYVSRIDEMIQRKKDME
ncbi:coproporphyrinogen dehydrogenase HemZ [Acetivibrio clariflavus]|uniref:coproporphyrinogen dehydrogenase HemZ n=1 Tax=Acetivibrio clariflavus TaxID=288965 RepID=UPI000489D4EC|nr:coproporphyrinogen dehydrogenase HemZ [Acetivibrio clariflavus]